MILRFAIIHLTFYTAIENPNGEFSQLGRLMKSVAIVAF